MPALIAADPSLKRPKHAGHGKHAAAATPFRKRSFWLGDVIEPSTDELPAPTRRGCPAGAITSDTVDEEPG